MEKLSVSSYADLVAFRNGKETNTVIRFIPCPNKEIEKMVYNGNLIGIFEDGDGNLIAIDIWGEEHSIDLYEDELHEDEY